MQRLLCASLVCYGIALLGACKRSANAPADAAAVDAAVAAAATPRDLVWDGPFGAARSAKGTFVAVTAGAGEAAWLGFVELDPEGREIGRGPLSKLAKGSALAPTSLAFADGSVAILVAERPGEPANAIMVRPDRKVAGAFVRVGHDACATESALYFLDPGSRKLHRWEKAAPAPKQGEGPVFDPRATLLCGRDTPFVIEAAGASFHVMIPDRFVRVPIADGIDPQAGGASAFYTSGDVLGVVAVSAQGGLVWSTLSAADPKPGGRRLGYKIGSAQTLVAADGDATSVSVLVQREGRRRCKEEDAPPSYDLVEIGREAGKVRERVTIVPPAPCDSEVSSPELERTPDGTSVRWLEWKDDGAKRLRAWRIPLGAGEPTSTVSGVPDETTLLDCSKGCAAIGREGAELKLVGASR